MTTNSISQFYLPAFNEIIRSLMVSNPAAAALANLIFRGESEDAVIAIKAAKLNSSIKAQKITLPLFKKALEAYKENQTNKALRQIPLSRQVLTLKLGTQKITMLHLAVMAGRKVLVEALLEADVYLNTKDWHNWTPLHHAAILPDDAIYNLLMARKAKQGILNDRNGTPADLFVMARMPVIEDDRVVTKKIDPKRKAVQDVTAAEYRTITGCSFIEEFFIPPQAIVSDWLEKNHNRTNDTSVHAYGITAFAKTGSYQPELCITRQFTGAGWALLADEDIPTGSFICTYASEFTGVKVADTEEEALYKFEDFDANGPNKLRGIGAFALDGPPNTLIQCIENHKGHKEYPVLISTTAIRKGDPILFNYDTHPVKLYPYIILQRESLSEFFKENPIPQILEKFEKNRNNFSAICHELSTLRYVGHTATAAIYLLINEIIPVSDFKQYVSSPFAMVVPAMGQILDAIEKCIGLEPKSRKLFQQFINWRMEQDKALVLLYYLLKVDSMLPHLERAAAISADNLTLEEKMEQVLGDFCSKIHLRL